MFGVKWDRLTEGQLAIQATMAQLIANQAADAGWDGAYAGALAAIRQDIRDIKQILSRHERLTERFFTDLPEAIFQKIRFKSE